MGKRRHEQVVLSVRPRRSTRCRSQTRPSAPPNTVSAVSPSVFSSNILAAATTAPDVVLFNALTGALLRQVPVSSHVSHLAFSHSTLLCASADGYVRTHDPRTALRRENGDTAVLAHASGVQDLQASGNFFFTIGSSSRSFPSLPPPFLAHRSQAWP